MRKSIIILFFAAITIYGCKNDIELNAPYKDVPVIYAFLDHTELFQYIRIQKIYQNAEGVTSNDAAKISDSLYYKNLTVKLIRLVNGAWNAEYTALPESAVKEPGPFANNAHMVYKVQIPHDMTTDKVEYILEVTNNENGNKYTARTTIVQEATIDSRQINIKNDTSSSNPAKFLSFRYTFGRNAYIYDSWIRFRYLDSNATEKIERFIDYPLQKSFEVLNPGILAKHSLDVEGVAFFRYLQANIPVNPYVTRRVLAIEYYVYGGGEEFKTLIDISKPTLGVVQKKPEFSNINGGLGLFSSRNLAVRADITLTALTVSELNKAINH